LKREQEALFYTRYNDYTIQCNLCPRNCNIKPNKIGKCGVRKNIDGILYAINYGLTTTGTKDPIEKKPLYHFQPGSCSYSFGTVGCNLFCQFCQNWHIARGDIEDLDYYLQYVLPNDAVTKAKKSGCSSIAYTYNEPIIWYEWVLETAKIAKKKGLKNVLVTNGYIEEEPLRELLPFIDAANVDVKGDKKFYQKLCKAEHQEIVLQTCEIMKEMNVHLEITNLVIPTKNDSKEQIQQLIDFVLTKLDDTVPLHFSRYFPNYNLNISPTPVDKLLEAREMALEAGLHYVYLGNIRDNNYGNTFCKNCGKELINRSGYSTRLKNLTDTMHCKNCGTQADIIT